MKILFDLNFQNKLVIVQENSDYLLARKKLENNRRDTRR